MSVKLGTTDLTGIINDPSKQDILSEGAFVDGDKTYLDNIKNGLLETENTLEVKNANGDLQKINTSEIQLNGNAKNTAGGTVELDGNGLVPSGNLPELSAIVENTQTTLIAGEDLSAGDVVRLGTTSVVFYAENGYAGETDSGYRRFGYSSTYAYKRQTFTITGTANSLYCSAYLKKTGSPTDDLIASLYLTSDDSLISDEVIISNGSLTTSFANQYFTLTPTSDLSNTGDQAYYLQIKRAGAYNTSDYFEWGADEDTQYTGGTSGLWNGSTWDAISRDQTFSISAKYIENSNALYKVDAGSSVKYKYISFVNNDATVGNNVNLNTSGVDGNQSGLTIGKTYYTSDVPGTITTTHLVSYRKPVGIAISETQILIKTLYI